MNMAQVTINANVKILPFGYAVIEVKDYEKPKAERGEKSPLYIQPRTTSPESIEIAFNGENYRVPKTTNGFL